MELDRMNKGGDRLIRLAKSNIKHLNLLKPWARHLERCSCKIAMFWDRNRKPT